MNFFHRIVLFFLGITNQEKRDNAAIILLGVESKEKIENILAVRDRGIHIEEEALFLLGIIDQEQRDSTAMKLLGIEKKETIEDILAIRSGIIYVQEYWNYYWQKYYETKTKFFQIHKCTEKEIELGKIVVLAEKGLSQKKIAAELGLSATQVGTRCKRYGIKTIGMI